MNQHNNYQLLKARLYYQVSVIQFSNVYHFSCHGLLGCDKVSYHITTWCLCCCENLRSHIVILANIIIK
jgi:hypothetical protein